MHMEHFWIFKTGNFWTDKRSVVPAGAAKTEKADKPAGGKAAPAKPSKFALEGNKWVVENYTNNKELVISETETRHTVYIYGLNNSTVQIKGKVDNPLPSLFSLCLLLLLASSNL